MTSTFYDMRGMNVYLSGPVSGREYAMAAEDFEAAEVRCRMSGASYVYNPTRHVRHDASHEEAMLECLSNLVSRDANDERPFFDAIVMLDGWQDSKGARMELSVARGIGLDVETIERVGSAS